MQIHFIHHPFDTSRNGGYKRNKSRSYSTLQQKPELDPNFVTGFTDAEGSFIVILAKDPIFKLGWRVKLYFEIGLHNKDLELLKLSTKLF